jgi:hypothetical protein
MIKTINDNRPVRRSYAVLDIETLDDHERYSSYCRLDPRPAKLRWPFKRICAAALLTFSVDEDGRFEAGHLDSWSGDDEAALLRALFGRLQLLPDHQLVTWAGISHDLVIIRMSAMEYGLRLPRQCVHSAREYGRWLHRDLEIEMMAGSGRHVHLSEVAVRLRLPVKFADRASMVPALLETGKLRRLAAIPEVDVLTTALVLCSQLKIHGELGCAITAHVRLLQRMGEQRPEARYRDYLHRVAMRLVAEQEEALARLAA